MRRALPTAPVAAAALIAGYATAVASGSRPLGGLVMLALGAVCVWISTARDSSATTMGLLAIAVVAFICSHLLGLVIGAWPAVLVSALCTAIACHWLSDTARAPSTAR